ncbi:MAG: pyridoxine 5'-phosphate synthase [Candidatus Firestonebacteria bacterium RIFOXYC2_FULL_39_67]|nr:MAG: pyridoxine 5'-phosphate synthase [Candidatus Firestonebacteria bacterium RIFOXYD2_FULL_39_29]OGF55142.1 MAG: pyridoxine 5'-phosphate synthase [Candidatus Firestonebacteria bacterium RIFOXYC2_FULL_39_67]OGF57266.1 MAG: pyridoxine 5'-phosphate synthase [Candidatus Firestonebacteria bacterium RifOxyC12_full_39_7]
MAKLNVNIDHVATLRQQRLGKEPSTVKAAKVVEASGADGITIHLREDRRHIQDFDVYAIKKIVKTKLNLEMAASKEIVKVALKVRPDWVTLVPEKRQELTTEGGLDVFGQKNRLKKIVKEFHKKKILVSMFVDPDIKQVKASKDTGADFIEIHTGTYADVKNKKAEYKEFLKIKEAAILAKLLGLRINAGHGLNYKNVTRLRKLDIIEEFSIGHSIISESIFSGLSKAVKGMIRLVK